MAAAMKPATVTLVVMSNKDDMSCTWTSAAPRIAGMESKKLNLAANSLSSPRNRPVDMVAPDRDIPGAMAHACATPINMAFLMLISFKLDLSLVSRDTISDT